LPWRFVICLAAALLAAACGWTGAPPQAIVGATLIDGTARLPVERSVLVIRDGRVAAMGQQSSTPVPAGATVFDASGKYVFPLDPAQPIAMDVPANLILVRVNPAADPDYLKKVSGRMEYGRWVQYPQ
jgi:hypothetical protein